MTSSFFVNGAPATKGSWRVMRGNMVPDNQRERPWADVVAWTAKACGSKPTSKPVRVCLQFFFAKPKRPTNPYPSRNDVDKLARSCLDALTGVSWVDDQQVVDLRASKDYADDRGPGVWVRISEVSL